MAAKSRTARGRRRFRALLGGRVVRCLSALVVCAVSAAGPSRSDHADDQHDDPVDPGHQLRHVLGFLRDHVVRTGAVLRGLGLRYRAGWPGSRFQRDLGRVAAGDADRPGTGIRLRRVPSAGAQDAERDLRCIRNIDWVVCGGTTGLRLAVRRGGQWTCRRSSCCNSGRTSLSKASSSTRWRC